MIFINLYHSKEQALSYRYSPNISILNHKGIQLLSGQQTKYIQPTNVPDGIELEDFAVFAVSLCGNKRTDISTSFMIERVYQDDNGVSQIEWSLKNLPDLGTGLVYLEVNQMLLGETVYADTWYSNVFQITSYQAGSTARIDYRDDETETMFSTQLQIFFWREAKNNTLSTYVEAYSGDTVSSQSVYSKYEIWDTKRIDRTIALKFDELFKFTFVYIDFIRCSPYSVFEIPDPSGTENDTRFPFNLSFKYGEVYDPNYTPPVPDVSPRIVLNEIQYLGNNNVALYYEQYYIYQNLVQVEFSNNGVDWDPELLLFVNFESPLLVTLPYAIGTLTYIRVISIFDQVFSNTLSITVDRPFTIAGVIATYLPSLNRWAIKVDYTQSYYNGVNIIMITKKNADNAIETTEVNDGSVTRNIIGSPGDIIQVSLRSTDNTFQSEIKTITLTL